MPKTAKLFMNGRSQAVRLPSEFRFPGREVYIRKDETTGDIILSKHSDSWSDFFKLRDALGGAEPEFMEGINDPSLKPEDIF